MEDCIEVKNDKHDNTTSWSLKNATVIKLTDTKMWLKRSTLESGYEISETIQSCKCCDGYYKGIWCKTDAIYDNDFANIGKACYSICEENIGECWFCGKKGVCCKRNTGGTGQISFSCPGSFGGLTRHECSKPQ